MVMQVTSSVKWLNDVLFMQNAGIDTYIECGPGRILSGLVRRIDKQARLHNIQDRSSLDLAVKTWLET